jgi:hypothetical protein
MSNAGRGAALPRESEPSPVEAIAQAYLMTACGDADAALRLVVADALATVTELQRRTRQAERLVSRGFVRGAFEATR